MFVKSYSSQEDNMSLIQSCLDNLNKPNTVQDENVETDQQTDLRHLLEQNKYFSNFVEKIPFEHYLENCTTFHENTNNLNLLANAAKVTSHNDIDKLILNLSNSISNPNVIDMITSNFLRNCKIN